MSMLIGPNQIPVMFPCVKLLSKRKLGGVPPVEGVCQVEVGVSSRMEGGIEPRGKGARVPLGSDQSFDSLSEVVERPILSGPRRNRPFVSRPRDLEVRSR